MLQPDPLFEGAGDIRARCRAIDWATTPLGPTRSWPQSIRLAVRMCLDARFPMSVWIGPELVLIYNDGYPPVLGAARHPWALGRPAREVWAEVWAQLDPELARVMGGESTVHEDERFVLRRGPSGEEECFFTYSFTPIPGADGHVAGALNVFVETTERVRAASEQQARYRAIFENASDAILVTDPRGAGRVLSVNPAACRLFGYSQEEFLRIDPAAMLAADADPGPELAGLDGGGGADAVQRYRRKDGSPFLGELRSTFYTDASGNRTAVAIIRDVTERERAQAALREALADAEEGRETLRALMDSVPEGITIADAEGVTIRMVSRYGQELLGGPHNLPVGEVAQRWRVYRADGVTPMPVEELPLVRAVRHGETVRNAELLQVATDGTRLPLLCNAAPVRGRDGRILGGVVAWRDIRDLKQAEEALREADRRKTEFLGVLSHELRNPLAPIKNSVYILERTEAGSEQARRAQVIIGRQVDQLARLVDDLLEVTRITRGKVRLRPERLDLDELVRRAVEDHRALFDRAGVRLELELAETPLTVEGDRTRLAQVAGNLLNNAAKFTPPGGRVSVSVRREGGDGTAPRAAFTVADTGVGLTPDVAAHLFEPFMQAERSLDRAGGGLGLGLALVKGMVELHGGEVSVASAGPGQGSEFTVRLPLDASILAGSRARLR
jgi:PAS domain S-box-containing protein